MAELSLKTSPGLKILVIGALIFVLVIPTFMIQFLIDERESRSNEAVDEIGSKWGRVQTVAGPVLTVPISKTITDRQGTLKNLYYNFHLLPDSFTANAVVTPEIRYRGLYEVVVYNTMITLTGSFSPGDQVADFDNYDFLFDKAYVSLGLSDMKGIQDLIQIKWNNKNYTAQPGLPTGEVLNSGVNAIVEIDQKKENIFSITINLNGSGGLFFIPVGKESKTDIKSSWKNPGFTGEFLPDQREITDAGFTASWKILYLNRNFPQKWIGNQFNINQSAYGVDLLLPVDHYQKTMRTSKYAVLFIGLTFLSFFLIEVLNKKNIHPIQYLFIGFALVLFYTLLLSITEYSSFGFAYFIASAGTVIMISLYTKSILQNIKYSLIISAILIILYGYLYVILQLQDYALLLGSLALFVILGIIMYLTRKIDWFNISKPKIESKP